MGYFYFGGTIGYAKVLKTGLTRTYGDLATNSVFVWGQSTGMAFHGFQEGRPMRLKHSDAMIIQEQVEGIEFVVPRNQRNQLVLRKFLDGTYGVSGDYPELDKVANKESYVWKVYQ